jgi:hypothetical protein
MAVRVPDGPRLTDGYYRSPHSLTAPPARGDGNGIERI